jgi:hypothetical protein
MTSPSPSPSPSPSSSSSSLARWPRCGHPRRLFLRTGRHPRCSVCYAALQRKRYHRIRNLKKQGVS